jgi:hypothetical protein
MEVPVKLRRPPSLPLFYGVFPDHSSFSVLRETPMTFSGDHFKKLKVTKRLEIALFTPYRPGWPTVASFLDYQVME